MTASGRRIRRGMISIGVSFLRAWVAGGTRRGSGGAGVRVQVVGADLVDDGATQVVERAADAGSSWSGVEPAEDRPHPILLERLDLVALGAPSGATRTRTTRRSSGTRTRSTRPRSSIRSTRPVALLNDTSSRSASRLIGRSPWCSRTHRMWRCVMLIPAFTIRPVPAQRRLADHVVELARRSAIDRAASRLDRRSAIGRPWRQ